MNRLKIAFIINPHSGTSDKHNLPDIIGANIDKAKFDFSCVFTQYAGHGRILASQFVSEGYDAVIACGGDGTMNEVASSLTDSSVAFGIVPFGSGNGLARHLSIPMDVVKALQLINRFQVDAMDYGRVDERKFFCTCGSGFDAQVAYDFASQKHRGLLTYLKVIFQAYWSFSPLNYSFTIDGKEFSRTAFLVTFANANQWGNDAVIAPQASVSDGVMDVCIMHPIALWQAPKLVFDMFTRRMTHNSNVECFEASSVLFKRPSAAPFHIDGDPLLLGQDLSLKLVPGGLKVIHGWNPI